MLVGVRTFRCVSCNAPIEQKPTGRPRKYCGPRCRQIKHERNRKGKAAASIGSVRTLEALKEAAVTGLSSSYEAYRDWPRRYEHDQGLLTHADVGVLFQIDRQTATAWRDRWRAEQAAADAKRRFDPDDEYGPMLEPTVDGFVRFYQLLFPKMDVTGFHRAWIRGIVDADVNGGRYAIQAPQRYGKTQLLVAYMVWLIVRDPDVRILFVARTADLAKQTTGMVRRILEDHDALQAAFLPEGTSFRPAPRSSLSWTDDNLTVATRTQILRSPTLAAVGAGGTLLGRDADTILCDDLEDFRNAQSPTQRDGLKLWFTSDMTSRKEEDTGWIYIGSSQHPEDLLAMLREDPQWHVDVYSAHNPDCVAELWVADPDDPSEPANPDDHTDCCLWPERRSYRWLFQNRQTARDKARWDMNMLGVVEDGALQVFPAELVTAALDRTRRMGEADPGWRLIAGLDPSGGGQSGYLSAVLWGVDDNDVRTVVDINDVPSGGLAAIRDVFHRWHRDYGLTEWVVEMNIADAYLYDDQQLADLRHRSGIRIIEHRTYNNKLDGSVGVPSMKDLFVDGKIRIPYADSRSQGIADEMVRQFRRWSPRASARAHYRSDILMAAWFPEATIRSWRDSQPVDVHVDGGFTNWSEAWATSYPTAYAEVGR